MKNADAALSHAKSTGKNKLEHYNASMNVLSLRRLSLETRLRRSVDRGDFVLYYQPWSTA